VFAQWTEIDRFVTDRQPEGALAKALRDAGTEVVVANAEPSRNSIAQRE
jgi:DeoR/GlpR family transcriptional regulator of sugar metabolism